jgi:hypothetical protein
MGAITQVEGWTLACAIVGAVCMIGTLICGIILIYKKQDMRVEQPLEVQFAKQYVPTHAFEKHLEENKIAHDRFDVRIGGVDRKTKEHADAGIERLRAERREDMRSLHEQINSVDRKVASLDTETKNQNQWLGRIDQKLDDLKNQS